MKKTNSLSRLNVVPSSPFAKSSLRHTGMELEAGEYSLTAGVSSAGSSPIRTLLVPLDGSLHAEHALPHALAIARRSGAKLRIIHAYTRLDHAGPWHLQTTWTTNECFKREKQDYLWATADRIAHTDSVTVETILVEGSDTVESLIKGAEGADLIVMASRRRGFLRRLLSPSVADGLRHGLPKPVLLVRGYSFPADLTGDPIARRILVPLNGSSLAERIVEPVMQIGGLEATALTLLNVQNAEWTNGVFEHTTPPGYLFGVARKLKRTLPVVDARIVTTDWAISRAITSYAEEHKMDLIALAAPVDERVPKFLRRNVVDALVRQTDLPILALGVDVAPKREEVTTVVK